MYSFYLETIFHSETKPNQLAQIITANIPVGKRMNGDGKSALLQEANSTKKSKRYQQTQVSLNMELGNSSGEVRSQ